MAKRTLNVVIAGDTKGLNRAFAGASKDAKRLEDRLGRTSSRIGHGLATASKIGAAAIGVGLVGAIKGSIDAFSEAERVAAQTGAVLKSTGGAARVTAKDVRELSTQISRKSGMDDEAIQSGENLLLTFTKLRNEQGKGNDIFTQATKVMADMSTSLNQGVKPSAIQLGKALNDPIKGVTALGRVGVQFTKDQKAQIKTLVDSGHQMEAQKVILKELTTEFGGSAEAAGNTFAGKMNKAKVAVGNLGEAIGGALAPALGSAADKLAGFVDDLATSDRPAQFFKGVADFAGQARDAIGGLGDKFKALKSTRGSTGAALGTMLAEGFENINWTKIAATMGKGISGALNIGGQFSKGVQDGIGAAMENVDGRKLLSGLLRVVSEAIDALFSPSFWIENFSAIFATVTIAIPVAKFFRIPGAEALFKHISKPFFSAMGKLGGAIVRLMGRAANSGVGRFVDDIAGAFPGVVAVFVKLVSRIGGAMSGLPGRLKRNAGTAMGAFADTVGDRIGGIAATVVKLAASIGRAIVDGIVRGIKSTAGKIGGAITGGLGAAKDFVLGKGEGLGKEMGTKFGALPRGGAISGSLMGAEAGMRPFALVGQRFGLNVSSGRRPGAVTSTNNQSWHATGEAVDLAGSPTGMRRTAEFLRSRFGGRLAELISPWGDLGIKNGQPFRYSAAIQAQHSGRNAHVHVAYDLGKPGQGDGTGRKRGTGDGAGRAEQVFRFFKGKGFTDAQAAAWVGNFQQESTLNPGAVQPGGPGRGLAQWGGGRFAALQAFARKRGKPWTDMSTQLAFVMHELGGSEAKAGRAIRGAKGLAPAVAAIGQRYERFGVEGNRMGPARTAYNAFKGSGGRATAPSGTRGGALSMEAAEKKKEALRDKIERNRDRLDALAGQLRNMPAGKKHAARRKSIQNQMAKLRTENRHLSGQIGDIHGVKGTAEERVDATEAMLAPLDVAIAEREAAAGPDPEPMSAGAMKLSWAVTAKRNAVGTRIRKIRQALKKKNLRPATRLRLQQELATRVGEHASLGQQAKALMTTDPLEPDDLSAMQGWNEAIEAKYGEQAQINLGISEASLTEDKADDIAAATRMRDFRGNQLAFARAAGADPATLTEMIDAFKSADDAVKALTDATQEQTDATKAHTEALTGVRDELKRQTDLAAAVQSTDAFQIKKYLADVLSGQIGGYGVARSFTPGAGREFAW